MHNEKTEIAYLNEINQLIKLCSEEAKYQEILETLLLNKNTPRHAMFEDQHLWGKNISQEDFYYIYDKLQKIMKDFSISEDDLKKELRTRIGN